MLGRYVARLRRISPVYEMWLVPTMLGVVFNWSWWLTSALLLPGLGWYVATTAVRYYRESTGRSPEAPVASRIPLLYVPPVLVAALLVFVIVKVFPERFFGLAVAAELLLIDLRYYRAVPVEPT